MIEDSEIKTTISPFAIREGEIKVFDGKDGYVSINQIIQKINVGHINELHFRIMELVNEFEFITSRQLFKLLEDEEYELKSQDKLNNKLDQLLNSRGIECKWQPTDNTKTVPMIKKRLAAIQTIIAYKEKVQAFQSYQIKVPMKAKELGKQFKTSGGKVTLGKNGKTIDFVFEIVRREEDWQTKFADKMKLYKDFYTNFVSMDSNFKNIPQLILVCEDEKHMAEVYREIIIKKLEIEKINLYYTTDLRQNDENLKNSLVEFKFDETSQKFKMQNINVNLLA